MAKQKSVEDLRSSRVFLLVLVIIAALGPASMSTFIPALPAIQASFGVAIEVVQLSMSLSMVAMAIATLFYGQLSDRFGRKPVLLGALGVCCIGSLLCVVAPTIEVFIAGRILQACGATAGIVLARAMVVDVFEDDKAASVLAFVTGAMMIAPLIGPPVGGLLTDLISWRANFFVILVVAGIVAVVAATYLTETVSEKVPLHSLQNMVTNWTSVLSVRSFWAYVLFISFLYSAFFAFLGGGPYVLTQLFGLSTTQYGFYFTIIAIGMMAGNFTVGYFGHRFEGRSLIVGGGIFATLSVCLSLILLLFGVWNPAVVFGPAALMAFAAGIATPSAQIGATSSVKELAGTASGLIGFIQTLFSSIAAQTVAMAFNGTPYPMLGIMVASCALAVLSIAWFLPARVRTLAASAADKP
jgi:DHA1 family bicyclomycin/chloramphenicol resistance-like MFS transporter